MTAFVDIDEIETTTQQTLKLSFQSAAKPPRQAPKYFLDEGAYFRSVIVMMGFDGLNRYELTHVRALVFYGAQCLGAKESQITDLLRTELGIHNIERIQRKDYNRVVDFLRNFEQYDRLIDRQAG